MYYKRKKTQRNSVGKSGSKKDIVKTLQARCEALWKQVCLSRDGHGCQVAIKYPEVKFQHTNTYQVDHCITRANKHFFVDPKNGTVVCSACNRAKHFQQKSINRIIDEIVKAREGERWFLDAVACDMKKSPCLDWGNPVWLEAQVERLQEMLGKP